MTKNSVTKKTNFFRYVHTQVARSKFQLFQWIWNKISAIEDTGGTELQSEGVIDSGTNRPRAPT